MSQPRVHPKEPSKAKIPKERGMSTARTSTLAHLRGSIERIETSGEAHALHKAALGHAVDGFQAGHAWCICKRW